MKIYKIILALLLIAPLNAFAEKISIGGQVSWSIPKGEAFETYHGEKTTKGGLGIDVDALYHFGASSRGLGVGVAFNSSLLFGAKAKSFEDMDIGFYRLRLYGVKGHYKFLPGPVSPYLSLTAGVASLSTPKISYNEKTEDNSFGLNVKAQTSHSFGLRPEVGLKLGKLTLSAGYIIPMKHDIKVFGTSNDSGSQKLSAGAFQISLGFRFGFL